MGGLHGYSLCGTCYGRWWRWNTPAGLRFLLRQRQVAAKKYAALTESQYADLLRRNRQNAAKPEQRAWRRRYEASHKERERRRAKAKRESADLSDMCIRRSLRLPISQIPPALLEAKRAQLKLHRLVRKKTT